MLEHGRLIASVLLPLARCAFAMAVVVAQLTLDSLLVVDSAPEATQIDRAAPNGTKRRAHKP